MITSHAQLTYEYALVAQGHGNKVYAKIVKSSYVRIECRSDIGTRISHRNMTARDFNFCLENNTILDAI